MKKYLPPLLALAMILAGCGLGSGSDGAKRANPHCDRATDTALRTWEKAGFSGSVAISRGDEFTCLAGYGRANDKTRARNKPETVFGIGSVTKSVTAATIFRLVDEGKLTLDNQVGTLLPETTGPVRQVTVSQLLLHTSGLNGSHGEDHRPLDRDTAVARISALNLEFKPGSGYLYSNAGYTLLGLIIDKVSGRSYRDYTAAALLRSTPSAGFWDGQPAARGPRAVGYLDDGRAGGSGDFAGPHWALDGNGGVAMSMRDLARWTRSLFEGKLVSAASTTLISTPSVAVGNGQSETPGWGHDASRFGTPVFLAAGGGGLGHNTVVAWVPERKLTVAIASNKSRVTAEQLVKAIGPSLISGSELTTPRTAVDANTAKAAKGEYRLDSGGTVKVAYDGKKLSVAPHGADAVAALSPPSEKDAPEKAEHERLVSAMLAGKTRIGKEERSAIENELGAIKDVQLSGTFRHDGELRTYVTLVTNKGSTLAWYSLNDKGGIEAVEIRVKPPAISLVSTGDGKYQLEDTADGGVALTFGDKSLTITGPGGVVTAHRVG